MDETLGQKLRKARIARGLSVEDAARATKIRTGRVVDIENDAYDNFTHMTYAKNFVVLYARYLGVNAGPHLDDFNTGTVIDVDDSQDLQGTAPGAQIRRTSRRRNTPLMAFAGVVTAILAGLFFWFVLITFERLGDIDNLAQRQQGGAPALNESVGDGTLPELTKLSEEAVPSPDEILSTEAASTSQPVVAAPQMSLVANHSVGTRLAGSLSAAPMMPNPLPTTDPSTAVAQPVERPLAEAPVALPAGSNEVIVRPLRETWVTVTLNDANANPAFDNFLRPGDSALRFTGERFWVFVHDANSVEIRRNSELVPQTNSNLYIQ